MPSSLSTTGVMPTLRWHLEHDCIQMIWDGSRVGARHHPTARALFRQQVTRQSLSTASMSSRVVALASACTLLAGFIAIPYVTLALRRRRQRRATPPAEDEAKAAIVVPTTDLSQTLEFCTTQLRLTIESIFPADSPRVAVLQGHSTRLRLQLADESSTVTLHLTCRDPKQFSEQLHDPSSNMTVLIAQHTADVHVPPCTLTTPCVNRGGQYEEGRAGMQYRDLVPSRAGGYVIASHIRIPEGGGVDSSYHLYI